MKFTVTDKKMRCYRVYANDKLTEKHELVTEFDAKLDSVPPHVAAVLSPVEVVELEHFLADRKRIQANSAQLNLLEALPELIDEATAIVGSAEWLNRPIYQRLCHSIARMSEALDSVNLEHNDHEPRIEGMRRSEALKERLEAIRQELSHP